MVNRDERDPAPAVEELLLRRGVGALDAEGEAELLRLLRAHPEARQQLVEHHGFDEDLAALLARKAVPKRGARAPLFVGAVLACAAAAAVALVIGLRFRPQPQRAAADRALGREPRFARASEGGSAPTLSQPPPALAPPTARAPEAAPAASAAELATVLRAIPTPLLLRLGGYQPDARGLYNPKNSPHCAAYQRTAGFALLAATRADRSELVEAAWRAIDAAFASQAADGRLAGGTWCTAVFVAYLLPGLDALAESSLGGEHRHRLEALEPRLRRVASSLASPRRIATLTEPYGWDHGAFAGAAALAQLAKRFDDRALASAAAELTDVALAMVREDGAIPRNGHVDFTFHAQQLQRLHILMAVTRDERIETAARKAGSFVLARTLGDGDIDAQGDAEYQACRRGDTAACDRRPTRELAWALALHGARFEPEAIAAADKHLRLRASRARSRVDAPADGGRPP